VTRDEMRVAARELVASWPPLSATQRAVLAAVLRPYTKPTVTVRRVA
jgi:hypothetical protein